MASALEPLDASDEAASVISPSDIETSSESITCTRLGSVRAAACRADS